MDKTTSEDASGVLSISECTVSSLLRARRRGKVAAKPAPVFLVMDVLLGDYAEGFTSANGSPSQKSVKHLVRGSEQPFFRLTDTCICAATGCDETQESIQVDKLNYSVIRDVVSWWLFS